MPPLLCEERQAGEAGVGQNGECESATAAEDIAQAAKESAAERPADEEGGLNDGTVRADRGIGFRNEHELRHERCGDERVEVHVQAVEHPAEPCGESGTALLWRKIPQAGDFRCGGGQAHAGGSVSQRGGKGKAFAESWRALMIYKSKVGWVRVWIWVGVRADSWSFSLAACQ